MSTVHITQWKWQQCEQLGPRSCKHRQGQLWRDYLQANQDGKVYPDFQLENVCILELIQVHYVYLRSVELCRCKTLSLRGVKPFEVTDLLIDGGGIQIQVWLPNPCFFPYKLIIQIGRNICHAWVLRTLLVFYLSLSNLYQFWGSFHPQLHTFFPHLRLFFPHCF